MPSTEERIMAREKPNTGETLTPSQRSPLVTPVREAEFCFNQIAEAYAAANRFLALPTLAPVAPEPSRTEGGEAVFLIEHVRIRMQSRVEAGAENVGIGRDFAKVIVHACDVALAALRPAAVPAAGVEEAGDLLPCPFCGGEAEIINIKEGENEGGSCVACTRCQASSNVEFERKENFVSNWNSRAALRDRTAARPSEGEEL